MKSLQNLDCRLLSVVNSTVPFEKYKETDLGLVPHPRWSAL